MPSTLSLAMALIMSCSHKPDYVPLNELHVRKIRTMPKIDGLQTFAAIVEAGSLSEASRRLAVSKSVVSERLAQLEDELGAQLLLRSSRRLALTEEGATFYELASRIIHELDEAAAAIAQRKGILSGPLRLAAPMTFGMLHLGPALYPFLQDHPKVDLQLDLNDRFVDLAGEGYDMAVRIGRLPDSSLVARKICISRRLVVFSPSYAERHGVPQTIADLGRHDAITYANRRLHDDWQFGVKERQQTVRVRSRLQVNNGDVQRDAAVAGLGIALLPTFIVAQAIAEGRLSVAPLEAEAVPDTIYAVYPQNRHLATKVRALTDHLRTAFEDPPYWDMVAGL
jgi:DNA-binding transcriptional LysR family regulator